MVEDDIDVESWEITKHSDPDPYSMSAFREQVDGKFTVKTPLDDLLLYNVNSDCHHNSLILRAYQKGKPFRLKFRRIIVRKQSCLIYKLVAQDMEWL